MKEGGMMMHNFVVSNEFTESLNFTASATSYEAGTRINLEVLAVGDKFLDPINVPQGQFIAIQAFSRCTLFGDHGVFTAKSDELVSTCDSGLYSDTPTPFTGKSTMTWTAGLDTVGDVTFTLVWGNGPAATDPLSQSGAVVVPDAYLFMKTITLSGPEGPCPPDSPSKAPNQPGSRDQCVHSRSSLEGLHAPVFLQNLGDGEEVTFPSGRCIRCRADHRGRCQSAKVSCPTEPGELPTESIWASSRSCEGEASRTVHLRSSEVYCPGAHHYSPVHLDLERFVPKLQKDFPTEVPDEATARLAVEEYRKMLTLIQKFPDNPVVPSKLVDLAWHSHILDTVRYKRDTLRMFGSFIHHNPSFGGEDEKQELETQQQDMFKLYKDAFGEAPPSGAWPTYRKKVDPPQGEGGVMPDCCSALCVKPSCHDCVGCNSVDCGYLQGAEEDVAKGSATRMLSPDSFAGYVPTSKPSLSSSEGLPYACSVEPMPGMKLEWTITNNRIHFNHSLAGKTAWYGIGLTSKAPFDMGEADYMISMMTRNYTGVKDLYRWDKGQGYPCWDVIYECSEGNLTKGTKDIENEAITRHQHLTHSSWTRLLITGDVKDEPILERQAQTVHFAYGTDDWFDYHAAWSTCQIDFYSGSTSCGETSFADSSSFI